MWPKSLGAVFYRSSPYVPSPSQPQGPQRPPQRPPQPGSHRGGQAPPPPRPPAAQSRPQQPEEHSPGQPLPSPRAQAPPIPWRIGMPWPAGQVLRPQQQQPPPPPRPQPHHFELAAQSLQRMSGLFDRFVALTESRAAANAQRSVILERNAAIGGLMMPQEYIEVERIEGETRRLTQEMVEQRGQIMSLFHSHALSGAVLLELEEVFRATTAVQPPPRPAQQVPPPTPEAQQRAVGRPSPLIDPPEAKPAAPTIN